MLLLQLSFILTLYAVVSVTNAAIFDRFNDIPQQEFDFIVIGGGTAGNVIANRLSENPNFNILVLEAGISNEDIFVSEVPGFSFQASLPQAHPWVWNYTTVPQTRLNRRVISFARGYVLGGCSSINGLVYTRGSSEDYDRFAKVTGDEGWSWKRLQPYIRKSEKFILPSGIPNSTEEFDPSAHGFHGMISVSLPQTGNVADPLVFEASTELGGEFSFNRDVNSGNQLGIGWIQSTIRNGVRSSSATSYLAQEFIQRPNLNVLLHANATRVLPSFNSKRHLVMNGVELSQDLGVTKRTLFAKKEVILSAGTYGTPHVLFHSGIGDSQLLSKLGIPVLHDLPSVGKNLTEQSATGISWVVNTTDTPDTAARNATLAAEELAQWMVSHSGVLGDELARQIGFMRVNMTGTPFEKFPDPSAGPNTAHFELGILPGNYFSPNSSSLSNFFSIAHIVVSPASRGTVTINSTNPFDSPIIDLGLFTSDFDLFVLREAFRSSEKFMSASTWNGFVIAPSFNITTDDDFHAFIRANAGIAHHPVGTAAMSAVDSSWAVVNPDLKVKGVEGLRIVDASVMPFVTASHTQAPVYVIAERASDLIKWDWMK